MSLPVEVPGLDTIIPQIGEGRLVTVESGADLSKSFFIRRLALTAFRRGSHVAFVTSRDRGELTGQLHKEGGLPEWLEGNLTVHEEDRINGLEELTPEQGLLAVDSFSFLTLDMPPQKIAALLRGLRTVCRERKSIAVLATDRGMFDPRAEAITMHLSDGVIQFHSKEGPEGLSRFLRIPQWMDGRFVDRNIYYEFDGHRLAIDLRRRVL